MRGVRAAVPGHPVAAVLRTPVPGEVGGDDVTHDHARAIAAWLFALAHASRLRMVQALADGELTAGVWAIMSRVGAFSLAKHAIVLRNAGIVRYRRAGAYRFYTLVDPHVADGVLTLAAHGVTFEMRLQIAEPEAPGKGK